MTSPLVLSAAFRFVGSSFQFAPAVRVSPYGCATVLDFPTYLVVESSYSL